VPGAERARAARITLVQKLTGAGIPEAEAVQPIAEVTAAR
jgi:hypothetical protein